MIIVKDRETNTKTRPCWACGELLEHGETIRVIKGAHQGLTQRYRLHENCFTVYGEQIVKELTIDLTT